MHDTCPVCRMEDEDTFHLFCASANPKRLWLAMSLEWELQKFTRIQSSHDWFFQLMCKIDESMRVRLLMFLGMSLSTQSRPHPWMIL